MATRAVYTVLMGGYESLNDVQAPADGIDYVCFTDNDELTSATWRMIHMTPALPLDPHRSQRRVKLLGHEELAKYSETLYIDNSVSLVGDANELLDHMLGEADMGMARNSYHSSLGEEFAAVWRAGLDDHHRLSEQWDHYAASYPELLTGPVIWSAIIARRKGTAVDALCATWYEHVLRYSRRDQLSAPVAIALHPRVRCEMRELDNFGSRWHTWPVPLERNLSMRSGASTLRVPQEFGEALAQYDRASELEALVALNAEQHELLTQAIAEIRSSNSWRLTAPLRALRRK